MAAAVAGWLRRAWGHDLAWSFRRSPITIVAAFLTVVCVGSALFAPWVAPHNPFDSATLNLSEGFTPPAWTDKGSKKYLLGTDDQGRDVLSTIMYGARISLGVGLAAVLFSATLGVSLGLLSGYLGGRVDAFIMRVADIQLSFPAILIALLIDGMARIALPREVARRDRHLRPGPGHRRVRLGAVRAHRARLDAGGEEQGVRPGGARHRPPSARHHAARTSCPTSRARCW